MNVVQFGGALMNTVITSKENLLQTSRDLVRERGWTSISIRAVAEKSGVSVGTIYNYFPSKSALISDTVESVWCDIFHESDEPSVFQSIEVCIQWMYDRMSYGNDVYPDFFTVHSLGFMHGDKIDGVQRMHHTWKHILDGLCMVLRNDRKIRPDAFNDGFTREQFADMLFSLMLAALTRKDYNPAPVLEMIRRTLY